jgi:surface antigen
MVALLQACSAVPDTADGRIELNASERSALDALVQQTLETRVSGDSLDWNGISRPVSATVTPIRTYQTADTFCREYEVTVSLGPDSETSRNTACRDNNGTWAVFAG